MSHDFYGTVTSHYFFNFTITTQTKLDFIPIYFFFVTTLIAVIYLAFLAIINCIYNFPCTFTYLANC